jgi:hypothetical protein
MILLSTEVEHKICLAIAVVDVSILQTVTDLLTVREALQGVQYSCLVSSVDVYDANTTVYVLIAISERRMLQTAIVVLALALLL